MTLVDTIELQTDVGIIFLSIFEQKFHSVIINADIFDLN
jgi:hypothetical protein